ncbi:RPE-retinal G protein-coupled receptor isoform X1 [Meles meles]|uniref:RPE-retinal G protein-coupled receptor isoform X1 n=1 Tax=Meles meles TaxID=9662 RepID=UPI001E69AFF1|nr:RPE-retinal G protein-coupled receptor isoform X1 [Meles meles]
MAESGSLPTGFGELEVLAVGTVLLVEALTGLCLNSLTILSFCKMPELRTPTHLLVLSLALADSGISLNALVAATASLCRPTADFWSTGAAQTPRADLADYKDEGHRPRKQAASMSWPYGSDGCQAHGFQGFVTALASICGTAAVAWGRYHHYCTRSQLAWNTAISLVICVWLSSAFWAALPLLGWGRYDYEPLGTCCTLDYSRADRNFISFLFTMAFFNFFLPLFITVISYRLMEQKLRKTGHLQVNTTLPARTLLFGWGPYALLYLSATIVDVSSISPKLQMVPALIAKTVPTINAISYALGSEMVHKGIWQCLSPQRSERDRAR